MLFIQSSLTTTQIEKKNHFDYKVKKNNQILLCGQDTQSMTSEILNFIM